MAVTAQFTEPFSYVDTPAMNERIEAVATARNISKAQVLRELAAAGIDALEAEIAELGAAQ